MGVHAPVKRASATPWDRIDAIRVQQRVAGDDIPAGAFTIDEYVVKYRLPRKTAMGQLERLVAAGKLRTGMRVSERTHRWTRFYWLPQYSRETA